jgi:hypothetical protein
MGLTAQIFTARSQRGGGSACTSSPSVTTNSATTPSRSGTTVRLLRSLAAVQLPDDDEHAGLLLEKEPNNFQAQSLNALIEQAVSKGAFFPPFLELSALCECLSIRSLVLTTLTSQQRDTSEWPSPEELLPPPESSSLPSSPLEDGGRAPSSSPAPYPFASFSFTSLRTNRLRSFVVFLRTRSTRCTSPLPFLRRIVLVTLAVSSTPLVRHRFVRSTRAAVACREVHRDPSTTFSTRLSSSDRMRLSLPLLPLPYLSPSMRLPPELLVVIVRHLSNSTDPFLRRQRLLRLLPISHLINNLAPSELFRRVVVDGPAAPDRIEREGETAVEEALVVSVSENRCWMRSASGTSCNGVEAEGSRRRVPVKGGCEVDA